MHFRTIFHFRNLTGGNADGFLTFREVGSAVGESNMNRKMPKNDGRFEWTNWGRNREF
jgi:hypothetical protein